MADLTARLLDALTRGDHDQHDALYREVYRELKAGGRIVPAPVEPGDDEVERAARAARDRWCRGRTKWEDCSVVTQGEWRGVARAAVEAARPVPHTREQDR